MKVKELFDFLHGVVPHAYPETVLTTWLNEVEGRVQTEVLLLQDTDLTRLVWPDCQEQELLAKFPYDSIYWTYLAAMCAYASGEMEDYNNHLTLFNERWCMYSAWYADNYRPADGHAVEREYYLTAFSIAQRHGFEGTEDEWLASLKGDKGEPLHWEDLTAEQKAELKGEPGEDGKDGKDGDENVFVATYGVTAYAELKAAYNAGKVMFLWHSGMTIPFIYKEGTSFVFAFNNTTKYVNRWCTESGIWGQRNIDLPTDARVTALEEKVTAMEDGIGYREVYFATSFVTTKEEMEAAYNAGKLLILRHGDMNMLLDGREDEEFRFCASKKMQNITVTCDPAGVWFEETTMLATEEQIAEQIAALNKRFDEEIGDAVAALDAILSIQNEIIGDLE